MGSSVVMQDKTLGVLLVDDHWLVREGLRLLIDRADGFVAVGEAADGDEALCLAERWMPEFILLDVALPGISGIELIPKLLELGLPALLDRFDGYARQDPKSCSPPELPCRLVRRCDTLASLN